MAEIGTVFARLADPDPAAVKQAFYDILQQFAAPSIAKPPPHEQTLALDDPVLRNAHQRIDNSFRVTRRRRGGRSKDAETLHDAWERFWAAALFLGVHRHFGLGAEDFTRHLHVDDGSNFQRKLSHTKTLLARWGDDFWSVLTAARLHVTSDPSRALVDRLMQTSEQYGSPDDFAAQLQRDRAQFVKTLSRKRPDSPGTLWLAGKFDVTVLLLTAYRDWRARPHEPRCAKRARLESSEGDDTDEEESLDATVASVELGRAPEEPLQDEETFGEDLEIHQEEDLDYDQDILPEEELAPNEETFRDEEISSEEYLGLNDETLPEEQFGRDADVEEDEQDPQEEDSEQDYESEWYRKSTPHKQEHTLRRDDSETWSATRTRHELTLTQTSPLLSLPGSSPRASPSGSNIARRRTKEAQPTGVMAPRASTDDELYNGALSRVSSAITHAKGLRNKEQTVGNHVAKAQADLNLVANELFERHPELPAVPAYENVKSHHEKIVVKVAALQGAELVVQQFREKYADQPDALQAMTYNPEFLAKALTTKKDLEEGLTKMEKAQAELETKKSAHTHAKSELDAAMRKLAAFDEQYRKLREGLN
ncbi:hypothetical protein P171DRAFT_526875 [Karstenula rhodostoma CBS 690.94]|uniref:Uncharacterized protein n=1 Tax=Karstenula rhodostoma CBS 690.94 TaxID=1392251 RepID=A0A9P4P6M9_9PLEO|nr:hypothetical protein P171DRAFT_526875 [Karstenula rhodostoma CBS 690.94]